MTVFTNSSDEDLVSLFVKGDDMAFEELYLRYSHKIRRLIYFYLGNSGDSDDIMHEVFLRFIKHASGFNSELKFSSWIYRIAVNCCKNHIGSIKKNETLIDREIYKMRSGRSFDLSPEESLIQEFETREFNKAVSSLSEKFKDVFLLRYDQRLKYTDVAEILKISERAAKWRMKKAVESISRHLSDEGIV